MKMHDDEQLDALLSAVRAEPDPRVWARVRARLAAGREEPRWVAWLGRPVTLAASAATLVIVLGGSLLLFAGGSTVEATSLTDQLLAERGAASAAELSGTAATETTDAVSDGGGLQ